VSIPEYLHSKGSLSLAELKKNGKWIYGLQTLIMLNWRHTKTRAFMLKQETENKSGDRNTLIVLKSLYDLRRGGLH